MKQNVSLSRSFQGLLLVAGGVLALATIASAETVSVVSPGQMGTWSFSTVQTVGGNYAPCTPLTGVCGSGSMVYGPATPPLGVGSANLQTGPGGGDGEAKIDSSALNGLVLSSITALSYSTYDTVNNGQQFPYLKLYLTWDGGLGSDAVYFEPTYSPGQAPLELNTWQTWNALAGNFWDDNGTCNPGVDNVCSLSTLVGLLGLTEDEITVDAVNPPDGDGLSLRVGGASPGDNFNGYVDDVTIGINGQDTAYDFEPAASTPEPGTVVLFATGLALCGLVSRRKRQA